MRTPISSLVLALAVSITPVLPSAVVFQLKGQANDGNQEVAGLYFESAVTTYEVGACDCNKRIPTSIATLSAFINYEGWNGAFHSKGNCASESLV